MIKNTYDVSDIANDPQAIEINATAYVPKQWHKTVEHMALQAGVPIHSMLSAILQMGFIAWYETSPKEKKRVLNTLGDMARSMTKGDIIGLLPIESMN